MGQRQDGNRRADEAAEIRTGSSGRVARETIYALASGRGRAGVAVLRISGEKAFAALSGLTRSAPPPAPRVATLRRFVDRTGEPIDEGLALCFPRPASFTGEDVLELHLHGGRAVLDAMFEALGALGLRPAEPGEFTRRAVENGRLDLARAEGVLDLVNAETEAQRRQALGQFGGNQSRLYESWRKALIQAAAFVEASIDFADEDLPEDLWKRGATLASEIEVAIAAHLATGKQGELIRDGLLLTVIGPPNAGKSSLINTLARRDVAIVSETPGTTRDVIEVHLDLGGYPITVADTAGLRMAADAIEEEGVRRAHARAEAADLVLLLLDGSLAEPLAGLSSDLPKRASLVVWNKSDLAWPAPRDGLSVSTRTNHGIAELLAAIATLAKARLETPRDAIALTNARHRHQLEAATAAIGRATKAQGSELCAEDLRLAARALGRITGQVDIEDVLDVVFREFCIGK
jgi:tRNA modification GTPase